MKFALSFVCACACVSLCVGKFLISSTNIIFHFVFEKAKHITVLGAKLQFICQVVKYTTSLLPGISLWSLTVYLLLGHFLWFLCHLHVQSHVEYSKTFHYTYFAGCCRILPRLQCDCVCKRTVLFCSFWLVVLVAGFTCFSLISVTPPPPMTQSPPLPPSPPPYTPCLLSGCVCAVSQSTPFIHLLWSVSFLRCDSQLPVILCSLWSGPILWLNLLFLTPAPFQFGPRCCVLKFVVKHPSLFHFGIDVIFLV